MNKKADIAILIPLLAIILLGVLVYGLMATHIEWSDTQPVIGEKPEAVFSAYGDADALRIYSQYALDEAIREAQNTATSETINEVIQEHYTQLLATNKKNPLYTNPAVQRRLQDVTTTLSDPVRIPVRYRTPAQPPSESRDRFTQWPAQGTPQLSKLFGVHENARTSSNNPAIYIPANQGQRVQAPGEGVVQEVTTNRVVIAHTNGYTCTYTDLEPTVSESDELAAANELGVARNQPLQMRCYNHETLLNQEAAEELLGEERVSNAQPPASTAPYAIILNDNVHTDPYCLYSQDIQRFFNQQANTNPNIREELRGLEKRNQTLPYEEQLSETCNAYTQAQLYTKNGESQGDYLQAALDLIIENEGSTCVEDEFDRGGRTKYGVTADTLSNARQISFEQAYRQVCDLTREEAEQIFVQLYLYEPGLDELPALLVPVAWDMAVNTGQATATRHLQEVLVERGYLDEVRAGVNDEFLQAAQEAATQDPALLDAIADRRREFYTDIVAGDATQERFLDGWLARVEKYRQPLGAQAGLARGTYALELTTQGRISDVGWQNIEERTDLRNALRECDYQDASCIQTATQPTSYQACSEPTNQLSALIAACGEQLRTGCSCQLPLGVVPVQSNFTFNHRVIQVNDTLRVADWLAQEGSDEYEVYLAAENNETRVSVHAFNRTTGQLRFSEITPAGVGPADRTLNEQDGVVYYRVQTQAEEAVVFFSATNQTGMCEQTIQERYCRGEEEYVDVDHPLTRP